jgi:hypothetical protein
MMLRRPNQFATFEEEEKKREGSDRREKRKGVKDKFERKWGNTFREHVYWQVSAGKS